MSTGRPVPTDSVTFNGVPFPVILPDQPYKHLGVRGTMMGDFSAEKQHVLGDMTKKLEALREDRVLSHTEREQIIVIAVCSIFNYSAGLVDWSKSELDNITTMWTRAYKQAWALPRSADGSPIIVDHSNGGRGCPSATEMWIRAVLDVLDQSISLPGEISEMVVHYLKRQCTAYGCQTLNQLQLMLRVIGRAVSVLELFLYRLDEQGLEVSSPWGAGEEVSIAESLWPALHRAWLRKQQWSGCTELDESVLTEWDHAQLCVRACRKLGNVEPAIWAVSQLRGSQSQWLDITELRHRRCHLTSAEYAALVSWLPSCRLLPPSRRGEPPQEPAEGVGTTMTNLDPIPPCIAGTVIDTRGHDQVVLRSLPPRGVTEVAVSKTSDLTLAALLCHHRAIFPLPVNDHEARPVECLTPLRRVIHHYPFQQEYIIVRLPHAPEHPVAVLSLALVRDCLLGDGRESLYEACCRPHWVVDQADFYARCSTTTRPDCNPASWQLQHRARDGQLVLTGLVQYISERQRPRVQRPAVAPHPWQADPPLPSNVTIDLTHHCPRLLPAPEGWEIWQRNGRLWIAESQRRVAMVDAAQYGMLVTMWAGLEDHQTPTPQFLHYLCASCRRQQESDRTHGVSWSRHLLTNIQQSTGAALLAGASAVTYNPHYVYYSSPFPVTRILALFSDGHRFRASSS